MTTYWLPTRTHIFCLYIEWITILLLAKCQSTAEFLSFDTCSTLLWHIFKFKVHGISFVSTKTPLFKILSFDAWSNQYPFNLTLSIKWTWSELQSIGKWKFWVIFMLELTQIKLKISWKSDKKEFELLDFRLKNWSN